MTKVESIKEIWFNYFFKKRPVEGIAIFRILIGALAFLTFLQDSLVMNDFWGPDAIQSTQTAAKNFSFPTLNIFQYIQITNTVLYTFVSIQIISLFFFTIGFKTRFFSILVFILMVSFNQRNINMLSSSDLLLRIMFMYLMFSPCGNAYSVDSIIAKYKGSPLKRDHASWVHRLVQIQIAVCYVSTVLMKIKGVTWLDGSAVYYATRLNDLTRFATPFILDWKWSIMLITWSTLLIEFSLGTLIFINKLKKPLIILGITFHLGIEYMMTIPTFEWLMIIGLLAMFKIDSYRVFDKKIRKIYSTQFN